MPQASFTYLRPEDIARLKNFEFAPKIVAEGYLSGKHRSRVRGSSIEFHDYRQYVPGDDLALVDWRVYARTDRHYLRTFEQETNLECHVFLDSSASMGFGSDPTKLQYASFFTACLCYLVCLCRDRVSLLTFDDKLRQWFPPGSTSKHLATLMHALEDNAPGNRTSLAAALRKAAPLIRRRGSLIVVSDFLDDPADLMAALHPFQHRGFRIFLFQILDPEELDLQKRGLVTFVDAETRDRLVAHTESIRGDYGELMQAHIRSLRALSRRRGMDYDLALTNNSFFHLFDRLTR